MLCWDIWDICIEFSISGCFTVMLPCNHLKEISVNDQTHEKFTFLPHCFKLYLVLWCISMSHVEIVKVVMLPDDFLLVLNYWEKPKLSLEWVKNWRSAQKEFTFFFGDILFIETCAKCLGFCACCKVNHNYVSRVYFNMFQGNNQLVCSALAVHETCKALPRGQKAF